MVDSRRPELEIFHLLRAVTVEFSLEQAKFASRNGMHPTDVRALICLLDAARADIGMTAGRLGTQLGLNSAGTTSVIDRLVRLGHITREPDERDRRRVLLAVDERAVELGWAFFGPAIERTAALLRGFDPKEVEAVRRFLLGANEAITAERRPAEPPPAPPQVSRA